MNSAPHDPTHFAGRARFGRRTARLAVKLLLLAVSGLAMVGLLAPATLATAQGTDPESVVRALIAATDAGDVEAAVALFSDDAVRTSVPPPPGGTCGVCTGKEQIRGFIQAQAAGHQSTQPSTFRVVADRVTFTAQISNDAWRGLGVAPLQFDVEAVVQAGMIRSFTAVMDPASVARLQAAMAAQGQPGAAPGPVPVPRALPRTGGFPLPVLITVGISTAFVAWGALLLRRSRRLA